MILDKELIQKYLRFPRGYVFRGFFPEGQSIEHVCIVLNESAGPGDIIYCAYMTAGSSSKRLKTQGGPYSFEEYIKRIMKDDIKALVELDKTECAQYFRHPEDKTFIQCNKKNIIKSAYDIVLTHPMDEPRVSESVIEKIEFALKSTISYSKFDKKNIYNL